MNRLLPVLVLSSAIALPALAALKSGEKAPDFSTKASLDGKEFAFSLKDALKKGPVVVYFYPSAYTGGCNIEAHTFAVNKDKFDAVGATIIGVSHDGCGSQHQLAGQLRRAGCKGFRQGRARSDCRRPCSRALAPQPCTVPARNQRSGDIRSRRRAL